MAFSEAWSKIHDIAVDVRDNPSTYASDDSSDELALAAFILKNAALSRSQFFQDLMVLHKKDCYRGGFFVEFGACDGTSHSNSLLLEERFGWRGILAEPNKVWHDSLFKNRTCFISTKCVYSASNELITFNQTLSPGIATIDAFSTLDGHAAHREGGIRYDVETITLHDLLVAGRAPAKIDYLSIDTEGSEFEILEAFDFSEFDIGIISVEHNFTDNRSKIHDLLSRNGYRRKYMSMSSVDDWYFREPSNLSGH